MIAARHSLQQRHRTTTLVPLPLLLIIIATCALALALEPRHGIGPVSEPIEARRGGSLAAADGLDAAELVEGAREWHGAGALTRRFAGPTTLAYVTPWHKDGYEYAVRFRRKLTHVSPVWYQLRVHEEGGGEGGNSEGEGGALALVGGHEYNATWLAELRAPVSGGCGGDDGDGALPTDQACGNDGSDGGGDNAEKTCAANLGKQQQQPTSPPLVVPRVVVELAPRDLGLLLGRPGPAIDRLVGECERRGYDGLVLEAWQQWDAIGGFRDAGFTQAVLTFIRELGARLKTAGSRVLLLAVPPALPAAPGRPAADVGMLAGLVREGAVAALSVMTYDHLTGPGPGPVAPLVWQRKNLELLIRVGASGSGGKKGKKGDDAEAETVPAAAVMLGVNFYGYRFSTPAAAKNSAAAAASALWEPEAVTSGAFLTALARFKPALAWDAAAAEHRIKYKEAGRKNVVYYPTPAGIAARTALAEEFGAGLSIWELGQGYEALFDLL